MIASAVCNRHLNFGRTNYPPALAALRDFYRTKASSRSLKVPHVGDYSRHPRAAPPSVGIVPEERPARTKRRAAASGRRADTRGGLPAPAALAARAAARREGGERARARRSKVASASRRPRQSPGRPRTGSARARREPRPASVPPCAWSRASAGRECAG